MPTVSWALLGSGESNKGRDFGSSLSAEAPCPLAGKAYNNTNNQLKLNIHAVLESGTGSGSLTHSLARAVAPSGHVHTFDLHQKRTEEAAAEFARHGLGQLVTVQHRNIEALGFPEEFHGAADALFLDLPGPWNVRPLCSAALQHEY